MHGENLDRDPRLLRLARELDEAAWVIDAAARALIGSVDVVAWRSQAARLALAGVEDATADLRRCARRFGELAGSAMAVADRGQSRG